MAKRFDGQVALVTGAGTGIGAATAEMLAAQGARVMLIGRRRAPLDAVAGRIKAAGGIAEVSQGDTSNAADMKRSVEHAVKTFGSLHLAVNNAGIPGSTIPIVDMSIEEWDQVIAVNLSGVFYCMKYQIAEMARSGGGAIVNISSVFGDRAFPGRAHYSAAKHGIRGVTRSAATECGRLGIRVNEVQPGIFDTEMAAASPPEQVAAVANMTSLGRIGTVDEIATTICHLLSDEAAYITGARFTVDGGFLA